MSIAPVAAAISGNASGAMKSKIQFIAWPGPAMKPSSDIALFTTTLPFPALVSLILFLRRTLGCCRDPFRRLWARRPNFDTPRLLTHIGREAHPNPRAVLQPARQEVPP